MHWRLVREGGTPGFLDEQKVYKRVPSRDYGGLTVLSLDKSEKGIARAMLYLRFFFVMG